MKSKFNHALMYDNISIQDRKIAIGYDEGCEYDKMCAHNPIHNVEENDGTYYYLISKNNIVKLESKKILI